MDYPVFFDQAPEITVHDGLAELLGACDDGLITYNYIDAVRLAGHSCPTVAGAYLMTRLALNVLYPDQVAQRGGLIVSLRATQDEGVAGVVASVIGLITGAAGPGGFKGIGGNFSRRDLLRFGAEFAGEVRFARADTGAFVQLAMRMQRVPADGATTPLLQKWLAGEANGDETREFGYLWQDRVRRILVEHADDPELIVITGQG